MSTETEKKKPEAKEEAPKAKPKCGIIMPIADNPDLGYPIGHWAQVRELIITAAENKGFAADMVSNDTQVEIIHTTIIKNIYANDVAVCDVSTRNPNVMFELGLRIASKKPFILIKDEDTPYSFDTQLIPHLAYRRDMRMYETLKFQKELSEKILTAYEESLLPGYTSFLGQFTTFTLAQIDEQQVGASEYFAQVAGRMQNLEDNIKSLTTAVSSQRNLNMAVPADLAQYINSTWRSDSIPQRSRANSAPSLINEFLAQQGLNATSKLSKLQRANLIEAIADRNFPETRSMNKGEISELISAWSA